MIRTEAKRRKALAYGLAAGMVVVALCALPMTIALLAFTTITRGPGPDSTSLYAGALAALLANLSLIIAPLSLPVAAATGFAAVRSARATIESLEDAAAIDLTASLVMALIGAFGTSILLGGAILISGGVGDFISGYIMVCVPALALALFIPSFFGGLVYSVYFLKLQYVPKSTPR